MRLWTESEIESLRSLSKEKTLKEAAKELGRTMSAVVNCAQKHDISFRKKKKKPIYARRRWTQSEITMLMGYAEDKTIEQASHLLKRSKASVKGKIDELKISFKHNRLQVKDVAEILGVSSDTVRRRRAKLGLTFRTYKDSRGPTGDEIVALANDILQNPSMIRELENTSVRKLKMVIEEYRGWE